MPEHEFQQQGEKGLWDLVKLWASDSLDSDKFLELYQQQVPTTKRSLWDSSMLVEIASDIDSVIAQKNFRSEEDRSELQQRILRTITRYLYS